MKLKPSMQGARCRHFGGAPLFLLLCQLAIGADAAADPNRSTVILDLLGLPGEIHYPTRRIDLAGKEQEALLGTGFGPSEAIGPGGMRARWILGREAVLQVESLVARDRLVRFRAVPFRVPGRRQTASLLVNDRIIGQVAIDQRGFSWYQIRVPAEAWRFGRNRLSFRMAYATSPKELGGQDGRRLAAALSAINILDIIHGNPKEPARRETLTQPTGTLLLAGESAASYDVALPRRSMLELTASKPAGQPLGDGFRLKVIVQTDKRDDVTKTIRAFAGGPAGRPSRHAVDLGSLGGETVRISILLDPGNAASETGDRLQITKLALSTDQEFSPARLAQERAAASPLYVADARGGATSRPGPAISGAILYLMDALRASDLSCYGRLYGSSPHIDRLSRQGALFGENFSQAPNTPPSVKAIMTGRYLPSTGHSKLPASETTVAEVFRQANWRTAAFSNSPFVSSSIGTDQGFELLDPALYVRGEATYAKAPPKKIYAEKIARAFTGWLAGLGNARFFAYCHSVHPHNPYTPVYPWNRLFTRPGKYGKYDGTTPVLLALEHGRMAVNRPAVATYHRLLYDEDTAYNDWVIARMLAQLRHSGRASTTLFALIADHGEEFLEHGGILHGYTAFDEMLNVPLVIAGGLRGERIVTRLTQSIDLAPTLLDLSSVTSPATIQGKSLRPLLENNAPGHAAVFASASSVPGIYSIRSKEFKYIYAPRKSSRFGERAQGMGSGIGRSLSLRYLFDLRSDPRERHNLVNQRPILAAFLHRKLLSWLDRVDSDAAPGKGAPLDQCGMNLEECRRLVALGYIEEGNCLCDCRRLKSLWPKLSSGSLSGPARKLLKRQLDCCPDCRQAFEQAGFDARLLKRKAARRKSH